jgi:hypothetical protein
MTPIHRFKDSEGSKADHKGERYQNAEKWANGGFAANFLIIHRIEFEIERDLGNAFECCILQLSICRLPRNDA